MSEPMNEQDFSQLATFARALLHSPDRFNERALYADSELSIELREALEQLRGLVKNLPQENRMASFRKEVERLVSAGGEPSRIEAARALAWAIELDQQRTRGLAHG